MEKLQTPELRTGEFVKLCGTTKRTLFHYNEIGLFSPAGSVLWWWNTTHKLKWSSVTPL